MSNHQFDISTEVMTRAKWPHEIFLINLVFNHILVFASTFGVFSTFPLMVLIVPVTSFAITAYIIIKGKQVAQSDEIMFVKAHWDIAVKRNKKFMWLLSVTCVVVGGGFWLSKIMGWSKIATIALLGGVGLLPFMVSLLVLIVLGNQSMYDARHGKVPKRYVEQAPVTASAQA
ncbi:MAG TPA: hypothetical protein VFF26_13560 [Gallionella sp.]|nr:hypothetical protein [Gallionella sp.]